MLCERGAKNNFFSSEMLSKELITFNDDDM